MMGIYQKTSRFIHLEYIGKKQIYKSVSKQNFIKIDGKFFPISLFKVEALSKPR
jgi:hypothetical protein